MEIKGRERFSHCFEASSAGSHRGWEWRRLWPGPLQMGDGRLRLGKGDRTLPSKLLLLVLSIVTVAMVIGAAIVVIVTVTADV